MNVRKEGQISKDADAVDRAVGDVGKFNDVTFQVKINDKEMKIIYYDLLKPCEAQDVPQWVHIAREKLVK